MHLHSSNSVKISPVRSEKSNIS